MARPFAEEGSVTAGREFSGPAGLAGKFGFD